MRNVLIATGLVFALALAGQAYAHDHVSHATDARSTNPSAGGDNPVGGNPSGTSGPASDPASVPGGGDPNDGIDLGTPSVDRDLVDDRKARGQD